MGREWDNHPEIHLESYLPLWLRLSVAAAAALFLGWEITQFFSEADAHLRGDSARLLVVFFMSGFLIFGSLFKSHVHWTIRSNEIQIERKRIFGRPRVEIVPRADIYEITVFRENTETGLRVWISLHRFSGRNVESPALRNGAQADELKAEIAKRLLIMPAIKTI